ncbi:MAG: asparagine synthase (glutamine-hydrolyzing) [Candidatus Marinimicrobia bacterium]|nr:asparagine synthase (glutamine-hydrolyzing) [Candidatus Neomarinimicrobiota bacterium]|tara:strand:- start:14362 stop:16329 length:1968 start_codon:yes stop_codon:yes gene_type:complete
MCGITGYVGGEWLNGLEGAKHQLKLMSETIKHRGPDSSGFWLDQDCGIAFAHRRLSIIDLSDNGKQPMFSSSKRFVILFNGEIYNHLSLRSELEKENCAPDWNGHSDTETILAYIENHGFKKTLEKCVGMFAIVLFDREKKHLYMARDRMGEKPLYYGWQKGVFLFGSELKSLQKHISFENKIDRDAIALYLKYNYVPSPFSIFKRISKVPAGTFIKLNIKQKDFRPNEKINPINYWSLENVASKGIMNPIKENNLAIKNLKKLLKVSIKDQMIADVPIGAFLSGGIDSSLIAAIMQELSNKSIKTFTIGFHEKGFNEAEYAKAIANHLKTDHTELYVEPNDAMNIIPKLPHLYDEPFSDSSQIPTFLISEMTRKYVTVSLSGDGGDEVFGGYNRYLWNNNFHERTKKIPYYLKNNFAALIKKISPMTWDRIMASFNFMTPSTLEAVRKGEKIHKLAEVLTAKDYSEIYNRLISQWQKPSKLIKSDLDINNIQNNALFLDNDFRFMMMFNDSTQYLPDDILVKLDRAAMSVSLETRIPYLDHRIIEYSWRLPLSMKIKGGKGKWVLRKILNEYIPKNLIDRPKMGFGVPIDYWLRGPLRDWAEDLLDETKIKNEGFFNVSPIAKKWKEHKQETNNWQHHLWNILMFQSWYNIQKK